MHNNNNNNSNNLKNNYNWNNNNMMANATQPQPQPQLPPQQLQQQQVRISNWIYDTNRSQQHLNQNTNNQSTSAIGVQHEQHQQQQHQQQYMPPQYSNYQQRNTAASINCYYAPRLPLVQQQQQQHRQQQHCHQPLLSPQQHQHQQQQVQPPLHSPYAMSRHQQQPALTHLAHLQPQQASQPLRRIVEGIQSGVPTLTTSTLTPTTLRSIEETFIQLTNDHSNPPYQAGFIPPPVNTTFQTFADINEPESEESQTSWNNSQLNEENSLATTDTSSAATDSTSFQNGLNGMSNNSLATSTTSSKNDFTLISNAIAGEAAGKHGSLLLGSTTANNNNINTSSSATNAVTPAPVRRNQGGRRPTKSTNMTPEEEEKRRIRRERNKMAAARCRKRRVDQTNELLCEVDKLEKVRETLQKEVESLKLTKNQLAYILDAHRPTCQKIRHDLLSVRTYDGLIAPANNSNSNDSTIIGVDTTLSSAGRSGSPIDLKPILMGDSVLEMVPLIKNEPLDSVLDSNSSLDHEGPPSPKRLLLSSNNPMVPPALPNVATLTASLAAVASASLNTPISSTAPVSFASFVSTPTALTAPNKLPNGSKQRPNSLPTMPRNQAQTLALSVENKPPTDINGVAIQTPSTGMFNFDSLMDGGTGLTPVSGPLVPTCSSQNKHPLELTTPTSEPSKLVSL